MDINEAALKLAKIEIIKDHLKFLRLEVMDTDNVTYSTDCNEKAQELIRMLNVNSLFQ